MNTMIKKGERNNHGCAEQKIKKQKVLFWVLGFLAGQRRGRRRPRGKGEESHEGHVTI